MNLSIQIQPEDFGTLIKSLGLRARIVVDGQDTATISEPTQKFSKLDANGLLLPADATDHDILHDHQSGLMWAAFHPGKKKMPWADAVAACEALTLGGFDDWHAAMPREFATILDYDRCDPAFDPALLPRWSKSDWAWTGQTRAASPSDNAWNVLLSYGYVYWNFQCYYGFAVACRRVSPRQF